MRVVQAFIGIGSNLAGPEGQVLGAISALASLAQTSLIRTSSTYRTAPIGPEQPDYVNAVAEISTALEPHALLDALLSIERARGRVRTAQRWEARIIDLDLLLYGQLHIDDDRLTIPHPGIPARRFVLVPLAEIAPEVTIPGLADIETILDACPPGEVELLAKNNVP
jgi:2-amino-4-hydroxy-6-hydroxymethyldihydropteridine diphosphokinase